MFESSRQKLKRANCHIAELEREFDAYVALKPHRFGIKNDPVTGQPFVNIRLVNPVPEHFAVIIGDAIHNLRTALDHLTWELVGADGGKQHRSLYFIARDDAIKHQEACQALATPSQWIKDLFQSFEVFPGGKGEMLHLLNEFDNADKHRTVMPVLGATTHPPFKIIDEAGNVMLTMQGNMFGGLSQSFAIVNVPPGATVELDDDANCTPSIYFAQIKRKGAAEVLKDFESAAAEILRKTECAVTANPKG